MTAMKFYDRDGDDIDLDRWALLQGYPDVKRVAEDWVISESLEVRVSTVWIGIDMSINDERLIFETMIFGGPHDQYQRRWSSEAQAFAGHDQALAMVVEQMSIR